VVGHEAQAVILECGDAAFDAGIRSSLLTPANSTAVSRGALSCERLQVPPQHVGGVVGGRDRSGREHAGDRLDLVDPAAQQQQEGGRRRPGDAHVTVDEHVRLRSRGGHGGDPRRIAWTSVVGCGQPHASDRRRTRQRPAAIGQVDDEFDPQSLPLAERARIAAERFTRHEQTRGDLGHDVTPVVLGRRVARARAADVTHDHTVTTAARPLRATDGAG